MGLISRVSSRTYREVMLSKNIRTVAVRSNFSIDGQTSKGLSFVWNVKEGEEWKTWPGARQDSPQWWREIVLWNYGMSMYGRNGILKDDIKNEMFHFAHRGRLRCGDETVQQFLFRHHRAADLQASNMQLPFSEQQNFDDFQGRLRYYVNYAWSRLPVILQERAKSSTVEINSRGQVVKNDSIASSLGRSAF